MSEQLDFKQVKGNLKLLQLQAIPTSPPDQGYVFVYPKTDGRFYQMDSSGAETLIDEDGVHYLFETRMIMQALLVDLVKQGFRPKNKLLVNELKQLF